MGHKFGYWTPCGLLDIGYWRLGIGYWRLGIGYWRLDIGYGLLGNGGICDTVMVDFDEFLFEDTSDIL